MDSFGIEKSVKQLIMRFSSRIENVDEAVRHTSEFVTSLNKSIDTFGLKLVLSEGITNAVVHGNQEDAARSVFIKITLTGENITIKIKDAGNGFDWRARLAKSEADPEDTSGRGIQLMNAYGYQVTFNNEGNTMFLSKPLEDRGESPHSTLD